MRKGNETKGEERKCGSGCSGKEKNIFKEN
jgi:hypothetical protein